MSGLTLVTGGSGYFGTVLVRQLVDQGKKVRVFDLHDNKDRPPEAEFIAGDIRDTAALAKACEDVETIQHNIAVVPLAKDPKAFRSVNIDGTRILLETALRLKVQKVVNMSSSAIFGIPRENPVTETTEPTPAEAYGQAKLEAETLCRRFSEDGLDISIIRPRTIMGPGRLGIMQILFEWIFQGRNVPVFGKGDNIYQFVHADDLAQACIAAGRREGFGIYNIGAEKFCSMRETLQGLIDHAKTGSHVRSVPAWPAQLGMRITSMIGLSPLGMYHSIMYGHSLYFDITKAKKELNYLPSYSNVDMFCETYDWYVRNHDTIMQTTGESFHRSPVKQGVLSIVGRLL